MITIHLHHLNILFMILSALLLWLVPMDLLMTIVFVLFFVGNLYDYSNNKGL